MTILPLCVALTERLAQLSQVELQSPDSLLACRPDLQHELAQAHELACERGVACALSVRQRKRAVCVGAGRLLALVARASALVLQHRKLQRRGAPAEPPEQ